MGEIADSMVDEVVRDWVERGMMLTEIADKWKASTDAVEDILSENVPGFVRSGFFDPVYHPPYHARSSFFNPVEHPPHYVDHPSGIECIEITRHMNFNLGNAIKYIWRSGKKDQSREVEDLRKAVWYIQDEIKRLNGEGTE